MSVENYLTIVRKHFPPINVPWHQDCGKTSTFARDSEPFTLRANNAKHIIFFSTFSDKCLWINMPYFTPLPEHPQPETHVIWMPDSLADVL